MHFATNVLALALPALAAARAQYGGGDYGYGAPETTSASSAAASIPSAPANSDGQINIQVAPGGDFRFDPANITAASGTVVTFFFPDDDLAHSVTQTTFANPCTYLEASDATNNTAGFDSGLQTRVQFSITIEDDTVPIYFYCKQAGHCTAGMVGTINAPAEGESFEAYEAASKDSNAPREDDEGPVTAGVGAVATATPANTAVAAEDTQAADASSASRLAASAGVALMAVALSVVLA